MRRITGLALAIQAATSTAAWQAHAATETRASHLALVIGNGAYTGLPAISNCVTSAHVVTAALQRAGFTVKEQVNESNGRMGAAVSDFADALAAVPDGTAVLYSCGYAVGFDGRVFLLPVSATLERDTDALTQGLAGKFPVNTIVRSKAKAGLVLLDTIAAPGSGAIPFAGLVDPAAMDDTGFVAVTSAKAPTQGPSTMAAALSAAFVQPNVDVKATVQALRNALTGPSAASLVAFEPAQPAYLVGAASALVAPAVPDPAAATPAVLNPAERRRAQLSLQRLGYFQGRVNGTVGPDTTAAIRRYQADSGVPSTGQLTAEQASRLLEDGR